MIDHLPVGGTTGLSHEHNVAVEQASHWLADLPTKDFPPLVLDLMRRFGVTPQEACEAISMARKMRTLRRAFG